MAQVLRTPPSGARAKSEAQRSTRFGLRTPRHFRGRHHAAAIFVIAALAVVGFRLFPQREVTVFRDGQVIAVPASLNPDEALSELGLGPADRLVAASAGGHTTYAVQRARELHIQVDGRRAISLHTQATTVGGALAQAGITLEPADRVYLDGLRTTSRGPLAAIPTTAEEYARAAGRGSSPPSLVVVRARPVTVYVDESLRELRSAAPTVKELLAEVGLTVREREGDLVHPGLSELVTPGMVVRLEQARTITLTLDGEEKQLYTRAATVGDVLRVLEIDPGENDFVSHPRDTAVTNGLKLTIGLTRVVEEEIAEPIAPGVETRIQAGLGEPYTVAGEPGVRVVRHQVTYKDGKLVSRVPVDEGRVVRVPLPTIRYVPPGPATRADTGVPATYRQKITVWATWYNADGGGKEPTDPAYGYTATGAYLRKGICATDPGFIPLGTRFYVPGYGECLAADVGGAIKGYKIDLGYGDNDAVDWGSQYVEIYILD